MDKFTKGWVGYLRNSSRQQEQQQQRSSDGPSKDVTTNTLTCTLCGVAVESDLDVFRTHVRQNADKHASLSTDEAAVDETFHKLVAKAKKQEPQDQEQPPNLSQLSATSDIARAGASPSRKRSSDSLDNTEEGGPSGASQGAADSEARVHPKRRSPPASPHYHHGPSSPPATQRSRARPPADAQAFDRGTFQRNPTGKLWSPEDGVPPKTRQQGRPIPPGATTHLRQKPSSKSTPAQQEDTPDDDEDDDDGGDDAAPPLEMVLQPETRAISQEQLVAEVKGIYAGLVMVETKCIEVDNAQSSNTDANSKLNNEQWQALIALHRTLLHEHHDFFLASQHPSASPALRRLASKYAMPARMWRHGIHSFLELLRHRLPASLAHMLTFLYLAYSMMALLYETVPAFEDTWIECLGDLGRYRMAIEDDDIRDREVWTGVSRHWYSKASDKAPTTGRLYHHLAILARPNALQQLYYYTKSLCVPIPFLSAKESVMTLFDPVLNSNSARLAAIDAAFVRVNGILFSGKSKDKLEESMDEFLDLLDNHVGRTTKRWLESGYYIGIALGCSLLGYGAESNVIMRAISQRSEDTDVAMDGSSVPEAPTEAPSSPGETFETALSFAVRTYEIVIRRWGDTNTLPFLHTTLVFLNHMTRYPAAMAHLEQSYPWKLTALMLNHLLLSCESTPRIESDDFPRSEKDERPRPLPEDFAMRGLLYAEDYFPKDWFSNEKIDEDEKYFELASMVDERKERILWLGRLIASSGKWLTWDTESREFSVNSKYDVEVEDTPPDTLDESPAGGLKAVGLAKGKDNEVLPDADEPGFHRANETGQSP